MICGHLHIFQETIEHIWKQQDWAKQFYTPPLLNQILTCLFLYKGLGRYVKFSVYSRLGRPLCNNVILRLEFDLVAFLQWGLCIRFCNYLLNLLYPHIFIFLNIYLPNIYFPPIIQLFKFIYCLFLNFYDDEDDHDKF